MAETPYTPPPAPGGNVNLSPEQVQGFIDSVNNLNAAINRLATGGGALPPHQFINDETGSEEGMTMAARKMTTKQYEAQKQMYQKLIKQGVDQRIQELREMFGDSITTPKGTYSTEEAARKLGTKEDLGQAINNVILDKFTQVVNQQAPSRFTSIMDAIQESGLKQLRFGELPPQQILQGVGQLMQRYSAYRMTQGAPGGTGAAVRPTLLNRLTRGRLGAAEGGLGFSAGLGEFGTFLEGVGTALGPATIVAEEARHMYDAGIGRYRELTASGQLTGEGTMAGFRAQYLDPLKIFSPFGRIGWGTAQEIVQNAREQGFTGPRAGQLEQGMATVISKTGIQVGQATEFFVQSMREGGMSVAQVTQEMNSFHDATRNLNMNINDYTQMIMTSTQSLRDMGAGKAAPGLAQQLTAALPRAYRTPEGMQFLTGAFEKARGVLASMVGGGANVLNIGSERYARAGWSAMDTLLGREVQRAKDQGYTTPNDIATYLSETSPWFQGTNVNQLQQLITRTEHGRGIQAQISMSHIRNVLNRRMAAASRKVVRYSQLTDSDLKPMGLVKVYRNPWTGHLTSDGSSGGIFVGYRDQNGMGKFHALHEFTTTTGDYYTGRSTVIRGQLEHLGQLHSGPGDMGTFNIAQERKAKEAFIRAAQRSHLLSEHQLNELRAAKPFDVQSTLNQIMQAQQGPKVNIGTQVGSITVELSKQAQGLLTLVKERQNATSNGSIQQNKTNR